MWIPHSLHFPIGLVLVFVYISTCVLIGCGIAYLIGSDDALVSTAFSLFVFLGSIAIGEKLTDD